MKNSIFSFKKEKDWNDIGTLFLGVLMFAVILMTVYGILEIFGLEQVVWLQNVLFHLIKIAVSFFILGILLIIVTIINMLYKLTKKKG